MSYSDIDSINPSLVTVSFFDVQKGQSVLYEGTWYRALEDSVVNNGKVGFRAENEDFTKIVIETSKNDIGYAPKLYMEREVPTEVPTEEPTEEPTAE